MPQKCFVYGCQSGYRKSEKVPMFKVPKDDTLFIKWKKAAKRGRSDKTLSRNVFQEGNILIPTTISKVT